MTVTQKRSVKSKLVIGALVLATVAACSSSPRGIRSLGQAFVNAFNTDANGEALADISSANLQVNPNIDPFNP